MLNEIFSSELSIEILKVIGTVVVAFITALITAKKEKGKITTQFFKEKGTETQEKVLDFWYSIYLDDTDIVKTYKEIFNKEIKDDFEVLKEIERKCYIYCSAKTIKAISDYTQYIYNNKTIKDNVKIKKSSKGYSPLLLVTLTARIISRMKYDFTNEDVYELDLIKMRIRDLKLKDILIFKVYTLYYNIKAFFSVIIILVIALIILILLIF